MTSLREIGKYIESQSVSKTERTGIEMYLKDAEHGYYWLKGQKIKHIDDPITMEELDQVLEMDRTRKLAYDITNSWERGSIDQHDYKFTQLRAVLVHMNTGASMSIKLPTENWGI